MSAPSSPVARVGLGTSPFGNLYEEMTDDAAHAVVDAAWEAGIRSFDSAPHYGIGLAEHRLGAALAGRPRDEFAVSTKVGRVLVPTPERAGELDEHGFVTPAVYRREWDFSRDGILRSIDESLTRLGLDDLEIVYLHDPDEHWQQASTEGIDALIELREQGMVGAIGAGMNQSAMLAEFVRRCDIDIVMLAGRYTLLDRTAADDLLPVALERGIPVVAAAVYNSGLLSRPVVPDDAMFDYQQAPAPVVARARAMAEVCARHGVTLPDAALRFPLRHAAVASVVVGLRGPEQVADTIHRATVPIPEALWAELEEVL
jgi:D-threo-aldose 1-dehydrogenase